MASLAYIQISRICNQNCLFCSNPANGKLISFEKAKKIVDQYAEEGYEGIIWTGGEPTLYPRLAELIGYASGRGLPSRVITNGQKFADLSFLEELIGGGLKHIHLSLYSYKPKIQNYLSQNKDSFANIKKALDNLKGAPVTVNINTAINKLNADHLSGTVGWILENYPAIDHFVWNNLDPLMMKTPDRKLIPRLGDFEVELWRSARLLKSRGKTFRIERVPLCYMDGFEEASTETRKIVKNEGRAVYFLDEKGFFKQTDWYEGGKSSRCSACRLNGICNGLYEMGNFYDEEELYPVFVEKEKIIRMSN